MEAWEAEYARIQSAPAEIVIVRAHVGLRNADLCRLRQSLMGVSTVPVPQL